MAELQPLKKPPGFRDQAPPLKQPLPGVPPQRKPAMPPSFYHTTKKKKRRSCCRCCCCFLCCFFFILILVLAILGGLFYAWFEPKLPVFRFRDMVLNKFNITVKSDGTALIDSTAVVRVEIRNPNRKLPIYYGDTRVTLTADDDTGLGSATVAAFRQPTNNVTVLKVVTEVDNKVVDQSTAAGLRGKMKDQDVVVDAAVKTKVGIGMWGLKVGMLPVDVNCGGVTLKQINGGKTSPKCSFHILRWFTVHS